MRHTLSVLVNDQPGVLSRVAGLFSRRGFNIDSLTVGPAEEPGLSRMTITTISDEATIEQIMKQLHKLIDVIKVQDITNDPMVERELILIKIAANPGVWTEITGIIEPFRAAVVDVGRTSMIIQVTGNREKNDALVELLRPYGIKEIARTGTTALVRSQVARVK